MNKKTLGFLLILVGLVWAMTKLNIVNVFDFNIIGSLFKFWPLLLVGAGVQIVFADKRGVKLLTWIVIIAVIVAYGYFNTGSFFGGDAVDLSELSYSESFVAEDEDIETGSFKMNIAVGEILIEETESTFKATYPEEITEIEIDKTRNDENIDITLESESFKSFGNFWSNNDIEYDIKLSEDLVWEIELNSAAIDGTLNLKEIMVDRLNINISAGDLMIHLGDEYERVEVEVNGAVADIVIYVPNDSGVRVDYNGVVKDFESSGIDFIKDDGEYFSENFDDADEIIIINVDTAVGNIRIVNY